MANARELDGYDEMVQRFLSTLTPDERLVGMPDEDVLRRYSPEARLAGVPTEARLAGMPDEDVLRRYSPEARLAGLSDEQLATLRRRIDEKLR